MSNTTLVISNDSRDNSLTVRNDQSNKRYNNITQASVERLEMLTYDRENYCRVLLYTGKPMIFVSSPK